MRRSLQARMLVLSMLASVLVTILAGWAIAAVLERFVIQGLDGRLDAELALLASAVDADGSVDFARLQRDRGGLVMASGWQWRITGPDGVMGSASLIANTPLPPPGPPSGPRSAPSSGQSSQMPSKPRSGLLPGPSSPQPSGLPSGVGSEPSSGSSAGPSSALPSEAAQPDPLPNQAGPSHLALFAPAGPAGPRPLDGTDADGVAVHARTMTVSTRRGPVILLAEAPRAVVRQPIRAALAPLLSVLAVLLGLLAVATVVQLRIGLAPVRRLRDQVEQIRAGMRDRVEEDQPSELQPLAQELNALAADNAAALAAARRTGANLAHALKTPVAVLGLDLRDNPACMAQIARIDATIRHHLRRARIEAADRRIGTPLAPALDGVLAAIRSLHADRDLRIETKSNERLSVAMDPHDLDEMLGNLLDNAARHARQQIEVQAELDPADRRRVRISIADDGPGIPADQRAKAMQPGLRLDERRDGHGFGLAIVSELLSLYGGSLVLADRPGGGLVAEMLIPGRIAEEEERRAG